MSGRCPALANGNQRIPLSTKFMAILADAFDWMFRIV